MTQHTIKLRFTDDTVVVDTTTSLRRIREVLPKFFRTPHGKREMYSVYCGFLIVRNTVQYTGCKPQRKTVVYLFTEDLEGRGPDVLCVSHVGIEVRSTAGAERLIDWMIEHGQYPGQWPLARKENA